MMKSLIISIAVLSAIYLDTYQAAPLDEEVTDACLNDIDAKLNGVNVPEKLVKLADDFKSLNPSLKDKSLLFMLDDESANTDLIGAGKMTEEEKDALYDVCDEYADNIAFLLQQSECGHNVMRRLGETGSISNRRRLVELIGYAKVCLKVLS